MKLFSRQYDRDRVRVTVTARGLRVVRVRTPSRGRLAGKDSDFGACHNVTGRLGGSLRPRRARPFARAGDVHAQTPTLIIVASDHHLLVPSINLKVVCSSRNHDVAAGGAPGPGVPADRRTVLVVPVTFSLRSLPRDVHNPPVTTNLILELMVPVSKLVTTVRPRPGPSRQV